MNYQEPVYLVMGSDTECKTRVADILAWSFGATEMEKSKAGVRTFTRELCKAPVVVDTLPFQSVYFEDVDWTRLARKWISLNSLRRMFGRYVKLVCVVNSSLPDDFYHNVPPVLSEVPWPHFMGYVFKEYKEVKILLVNAEDTSICAARRSHMRDALQQEGIAPSNIIEADLSRRGRPVPPVGRSAILQDIMEPFLLREVAGNDIDSRRYGPWGPERVILFGRTGCGKSSIAQMLVSGGLDPHARNLFRISSSIRGETPKVVPGEGRGWHVVDTPGFGEPKDGSTTSTEVAERRIKRYVQIIEGTYAHYLYVVKKDRIDQLEPKLWKFFLLLFGDNLRFHFTVVITNADKEWVDGNRADLENYFEGCQSFVGVDFPPITTDDDEYEAEQQLMRAESLKALEEELARHARYDAFCDFGRFSKISNKGELATGHGVKGLSKKVSNGIRSLASWAYADFMRLIAILTKDDKIALLPLVDEDMNIELLRHH